MKRFTAALLALLLAMSLAGCGLSRKKAESSTESKESQEKVENSNLKAGFLFSGDSEATSTIARKNDIEKMQGATGLTDSQIITVENVKKDNIGKKVKELVDQGCSIIFCTDCDLEGKTIKCAAKYPDVVFCQEGGRKADESGQSNYYTYNTRMFEAYHVGGLVAGKKLVERLNNGKAEPYSFQVGFVADKKSPEAISCAMAFFLGIKRSYSRAQMYIRYVGSEGVYDDDGKEAKQLALAGVSVMGEYTSTTAVAAVCAENDIPVVGRDLGMLDVAPKDALTSVLSDWSMYYTYAIDQLDKGQPIDKDWSAGYAEGANIISQLNDQYIAAETVYDVADLEKNIRAGKAKIFNTQNFTIGEQKLEDLVKADKEYSHFKPYVKGGQYMECKEHSAPEWDVLIDGSEVSDYDYIGAQEAESQY
jgi:basic membrane protein A